MGMMLKVLQQISTVTLLCLCLLVAPSKGMKCLFDNQHAPKLRSVWQWIREECYEPWGVSDAYRRKLRAKGDWLTKVVDHKEFPQWLSQPSGQICSACFHEHYMTFKPKYKIEETKRRRLIRGASSDLA